MVKGLVTIGDIQLYWKSFEDTFLISPSAIQDQNLILHVSKVYAEMLEYQIRAIHHLSKKQFSRAWQKVAGWSDWKQKAITIEKASEDCKEHIPLLQQEESRKNFSTETSKLDELFQTGQGILQQMRETRLEDKKEKLLQELFSAGSTYVSGKDFNPGLVKGTCEWLFNDQKFCSWRDTSECDLFWISAGPGCGKSVLSRALVDDRHLQSSSSTISFSNTARIENHAATTCYFFFKDDDTRRNDLAMALCAILHQLFTNKATRALVSHAIPEYSDKGSGMMRESPILWKILTRCADEWSGGAIICLIDALDELRSDDRKSLLALVRNYYAENRGAGKLKFIITSRPYDDIGQSFQVLAKRARSLHFDRDERHEDISSDINLVIDARINDFAMDFKASDRLKIAKHLKSQQLRTYLWLQLTLDIISDSPSEYSRLGDIEALLHSLPSQLSEAYEKILNRSKNREITTVLLSLLLAATRPLTLTEANYALTMALAKTPFQKHKDISSQCWTGDLKSVVKNLCGLLVNVYNDELSFIHLTARDFLLSEPLPNFEWKGRFADRSLLSKSICQCCISYLILDDWKTGLHDPASKEFSAEFPFISYAAVNWPIHLESLNHISYRAMNAQVRLLTTTKAPYLRFWAKRYLDLANRNAVSQVHGFHGWTDLAIASFLGLRGIVEDMLAKNEPNINAESAYFGSALIAAVSSNNMGTTKLLLDHGANVNSEKRAGRTAFSRAVANRNVPLVKLLLSRGADSRVCTALDIHVAVLLNETEMLHVILASIVDLDTAEGVEIAVFKIRNEEGLSMLLDIMGPDMPLTQRMVEMLMSSSRVANRVLGMIIDREIEDIHITSDMLETAMRGVCDMDSLHVILEAQGVFQFALTKELIENAAKIFNVETMRPLLKQCAEHGVVTSNMLYGAVLNQPGQRAGMFQLLLEYDKEIEIDEVVLWHAVLTGDFDLVKLVMMHPRFKVDIPQRFLLFLCRALNFEPAANMRKYEKSMGIVEYLWTRSNAMTIEYDAVITQAARYGTTKMMQSFLDRIDGRFILSEKMLCAAALNSRYSVSMMKHLIELQGERVLFTENVLRATLPGAHSDPDPDRRAGDATEWLLREHGDEFSMTAELVRDIVGSSGYGLQLMVKYKHQDLRRFSREVLLSMTKYPASPSWKLMMSDCFTADMMTEEVFLKILNRFGAEIPIVANILEHYGSELFISEYLLKRIARFRYGAVHLLHVVNTNCPRCFCTDVVAQAAIFAGQEDVLDYLSDAGSSGIVINAQDKLSARFWGASGWGDTSGMQLAIDAGFDPSSVNIDGETALGRAVREQHIDAVELLLEQPGVNVRTQDRRGRTPLHLAAALQIPSCVRLLLAAGADPDQEDNYGVTPYMLACDMLKSEILVREIAAREILEEGRSPLTEWVAHPEVTEYIVKTLGSARER